MITMPERHRNHGFGHGIRPRGEAHRPATGCRRRRMLWAVNKKNRRRRCHCCQKLFRCDPRTRAQHYCSDTACRAASKKASQERWLQKPENQDYFQGRQNVRRVQAWRAVRRQQEQKDARTGAWLQEPRCSQAIDRSKKSASLVLQEPRRTQGIESIDQFGSPAARALQDSI